MTFAATVSRSRLALSGLAAALALTFVLGTPAGQTTAAQFLAQFRSQRFVGVTVELSKGRNPFAELESMGTIQGNPSEHAAQEVKSAAEATQRVGFAVKQPDADSLPAGLNQTPTLRVLPAGEMRFTFDKAKARAYFDQTGHPGVNLPDRFDGASIVVDRPAAVLLEYRGADNNHGVAIGESKELAVGTEGGVSLDEFRDFLLGLPNIPPETARQLKGIDDWRTTLPVPIPADQVKWQDTTLAGGPGLLLTDNASQLSAAIWQRDGRVYGIAGAIKPDELRKIADSLVK